MALATPKQIELVIKLWTRTGQLDEMAQKYAAQMHHSCTPDFKKEFVQKVREELLPQKSVGYMDEQIKAAHARLGWSAKEAPATDPQRAYIRSLEKQILGHVETTMHVQLTYAEADLRIKNLKATRPTSSEEATSELAPIIDLFTRQAV